MKFFRTAFDSDDYQNIYDLSLLSIKNIWLFQGMIAIRKGIGWRDYIPYISIALGGDRFLRFAVELFRVTIYVDLLSYDWYD